MMTLFRVAVCTLAVFYVSLATAEVWTVGSQEDFVPYNYTQGQDYTGIDVEILETASNSIGVTLEHFPTSWRRALLEFDSGNLDAIFQLTPTPERFRKWHMVGPLRTTKTVFMVRKDSTLNDVGDLTDLLDLVVGVVAGFTYGHEFDTDDRIVKEQSVDDFTNVRKLLLGRSDVIVGGRETLTYVARELNAQDKLRLLPTPLVETARYIAFRRTPDGALKAERLQAELNRMTKEGLVQAIIESFLGR